MNQAIGLSGSVTRYDSVTSVPVPSGSNRYVHSIVPANFSVREIPKVLPGSTILTTGLLVHAGLRGTLLRAAKRAPTTGPVAPSSHLHQRISGLNSGVRVTSATSS